MQKSNDAKAERASAVRKDKWLKPEILSITPITDTRGNGVAGTDFGSEMS